LEEGIWWPGAWLWLEQEEGLWGMEWLVLVQHRQH